MNDVLKALAFLTKKGYVHRDISPGNIIIYGGRAKLNDLEFAKEYGTGTSNYVRTGTYNFMAVEVQSSKYMFYPKSDFSHNPLHDLESLWWVGGWFLLCHYRPIHRLEDKVQTHIKVVKGVGESLFNNGANILNRHNALLRSDILATSDPRSFPKTVQYLAVVVNRFRAQLLEHYENYKPHDRSFFTPDIHRRCGDLLERAMELLRDDNTELWPMDCIEQHVTDLQEGSDSE